MRFQKTRSIVRLVLDFLLKPAHSWAGLPYLWWVWTQPFTLAGFAVATLIFLVGYGALFVAREVASDERIWTKFY